MVLRLIGERVATIGQERVPVTIAAATGGHRLALLQGGKTAAAHPRSDVLAAILARTGRGWRRHGDECQGEQRRGRCAGHFQNRFHLVFSL